MLLQIIYTGKIKMPCYCDTPNEYDQTEIQKRCKTNMYFEAVNILNADNLTKAKSLGLEISKFPLPDPNTALCNICKVLTQEQMRSISACYYQIKWSHRTLRDWYKQHCKDDLEKGDK